jgi:hypothetical protein
MRSSATTVLDLLDRVFATDAVVDKQQLLHAAHDAEVGDDALEVMDALPDGEYTHEGLMARLDLPTREREAAREAGMSAHSDPGWRPPEVRRHPNR